MPSTAVNLLKIACIDGFYINYLIPVREYFADNHIATSINDPKLSQCLYHVLIGTAKDVNEILSRSQKIATHRLIFLINGNTDEARGIANKHSAKIALIDQKPLTHQLARVAFGFLFSGEGTVISLQTISSIESDNDVTAGEVTQKPTDPVSWDNDTKRIQTLAKQYFKNNPLKNNKFSAVKKTRLFLAYAVLSYGIFLASHLLALGIGFSLLLYSFNLAHRNQLGNSTTQAATLLSYAQKTLPLVTWIAFYQPLEKPARNYERLTRDCRQIAEVGVSLQKTLQNTIVFGNFFNKKQTGDSPTVILSKAAGEWQKNSGVIARVAADFAAASSDGGFPFNLPIVDRQMTKAGGILARVQESGDTLSAISSLYPYIAGTGGEKTYLLLLQNSMELRPTGGFIGSVGLLTFRDGTVTDISIQDVYQVDGQLRGHVDPPAPLKNILSAEHWYLRDSNWDPDFRLSGQTAAWLFKASGGKTVDGVIAVNLQVIQDILRATGPITLQDEKITISADTLFGVINKEVHTDFFPGSTRKQDLLGELSRRLVSAITEEGRVNPLSLTEAVTTGLRARNIVLFSQDEPVQARIAESGWGGSFAAKSPCSGQANCIPDLFASIEANLAVDKANYYVERSAERHLTLTDHDISGEDRYVITNNSPGSAMQGGNYTNYERFYYPDTTRLLRVALNEQELSVTDSTSSALLPYAEKIKEKDGFVTLGIGFTVGPGEKSHISIEYARPFGNFPSTYALSLVKQGGVENYPVKITLDVPDEYLPVVSAQPALTKKAAFVAKMGYFEYNTQITQDQTIIVTLKTK